MPRFLLPLLLCAATAFAAPRINEVQSTNTAFPDQYGQLMDWVEIHNPTTSPIDLTDHYLSDSTSNRLKFRFPATTIGAGEYLLVWCGQATEFTTLGPYPAGQVRAATFNISSGGEPVVLTAPDGTTVIDEFPALAIGANAGVPRSLGRGTGENSSILYLFNTPTQGTANTTPGIEAIPLDPPIVSLAGGIYTSNQSVAIHSTIPDTTVRFTLDGSDPTESSPVFTSPLEFGPGGNNSTGYSWIPTNQDAASGYPYYDNWQSPSGPVARIHVLRTRAFKSGSAPSRIITKSYLVHPSGTDRHTLPVVSIASDPANLFGNQSGIYVAGNNTYSTDWPNTPGAVASGFFANYYQSGSAWERPSHLEFFENGSTLLEGQIGLRINGNTTRNRPRKALRIYNRNPAGPTTWTNTQLFPDRDTTSWDTFLLRAAGNDWNQSLFRDALVSAIAAPTGLDRQAARPVVLYLNGEFWGIHNLRERLDEAWVFHKYGLGEDQFSMLEVTAGAPNFLNETSDYSWPIADRGVPALLDDYKDILVRAGNNEFSSESGYASLNSRIDLANFADYCAVTIWAGNTDWPGNNVILWRSVNATTTPGANPRLDGRWRYIIKDNDFALGLNLPYVPGHNENVSEMARHDTLAYATSPFETSFANNEIGTRLLRKTLENPVFKNQFINRFADLLNTTLSVNATTAQLDAHIAAYAPAAAEHSARWPTPLAWNSEVERIRTYLQVRTGAVRSHIASKFNAAQIPLTVSANSTQGDITVNSITLGSTTPGVGETPFPWTGVYFQNIPVTVTATAKPGYRFVSWSTSTTANGNVTASDAASNYSSWSNGGNEGTGFGPWSINTSTGNSGKAGTFLDNARGGWGLYANDGETTWVYRNLSTPLQPGQTFTARLRHGSVSDPGAVGFELSNASGEILFQLRLPWWSQTYEINQNPTDIPATTAPLVVEVTLEGNNSYTARITPEGGEPAIVSGSLMRNDSAIERVLVFNYSAGSGGGSDVFVTSLQVADPAASGGEPTPYSANATITANMTSSLSFTASFELEPATKLVVETPPAAIPGTALASLRVKAVNSIGDADGNYDAQPVTLVITGPNGFQQTWNATTTAGVAEFPGIVLPSTGEYSLAATSGELATAIPQTFSPKASARFLPGTSAPWNNPANWDIQAVPNNNLATVTFAAPDNQTANRDATLEAPVTIASVVFENGASAFRNRINGTPGNPLTFSSANGTSSITVAGNGTGHANLSVEAGIVAQNDIVLDVQNTAAGNSEYGALRLQGLWSGPGGFIKRGPGLAGLTGTGKSFSGNITIEHGALTFSEPAVSENTAARYTVLPGGQLRLSSTGNPRHYRFSGPIHLAGNGRLGVPDNENLGVLGALRLETGTTGANAFVENSVVLTDHADIHVPALNTVTLNGTLAGNSTLSKSGGGTLHLPASTSGFEGGIAVHRGTLHLAANIGSNQTLELAAESTLAGNGAWGGLLRLPSGSILAPDLAAGPLQTHTVETEPGALVSISTTNQTLSGLYPLLNVTGSSTGLENLALAAIPPHHPETRLVLDGNTLSALVAQTAREAWLLENNLPLDSTEESDPDSDGISNLVERALAMNPNARESTPPAGISSASGNVTVTYRIARNQSDLAVTPERTASLAENWIEASSEIHDDSHPRYQVRRVTLPAAQAGFLRLRITKSVE